VSRLSTAGEVTDPNGLASTVLAEAVGYPGSSVAFAQLLSGMERAGLIEREIRGKRTYRIALADGAAAPSGDAVPARAAGHARLPVSAAPGRGGPAAPSREARPAPGPAVRADLGFDYDELARRLLIQVVQRLATPGADRSASPGVRLPAGGEPTAAHGQGDLAETVASLERKLASIQSRQRKLSEENARLREQLTEAQQSLADMQEADVRGGQLDAGEMQMLERLLSSLHADPARRESTDAG
jgi:hypothetical protein